MLLNYNNFLLLSVKTARKICRNSERFVSIRNLLNTVK
uniref:Uncharacterized protein n=1 Tax=Dulem virus 37 TaxID=3145755 RepID=A0AAU8AYP3_9CAUD